MINATNWSQPARRAFRDFLLDLVLAKMDPQATAKSGSAFLSEQDKVILYELPVWACHGGKGGGGDSSEGRRERGSNNETSVEQESDECDDDEGGFHAIRCDLSSLTHPLKPLLQIPPRDVETNLLGEDFVKLRADRADLDRGLYALMGLSEPSRGAFFASHVLPQITSGAIEGRRADALALEFLRSLLRLENDHPGLSHTLSTCKLFRSATGQLCSPQMLFDPHVPHLQALLPQEVFPSPTLFADPTLLLRLRGLGMQSSITCEGVLRAAQAIQSVVDNTHRTPPHSPLPPPSSSTTRTAGLRDGSDVRSSERSELEEATARARGLLSYLESNIGKLLQEGDPQGWARIQKQTQPQRPGSGPGLEQEHQTASSASSSGGLAPVDGPLGGAWGSSLRSLSWIPVHVLPPRVITTPSGLSVQGCRLPWPTRIHSALPGTDLALVHPAPELAHVSALQTDQLPALALAGKFPFLVPPTIFLLYLQSNPSPCPPAPSQTVHIKDIWTCSSTHRICAVDVQNQLVRQMSSTLFHPFGKIL